MSQYATIKVKPETKERFTKLGSYNDTADDILSRLITREVDGE